MLLHCGGLLRDAPSIQLHTTDIGSLGRGVGVTVPRPVVKCPLKDLLPLLRRDARVARGPRK